MDCVLFRSGWDEFNELFEQSNSQFEVSFVNLCNKEAQLSLQPACGLSRSI